MSATGYSDKFSVLRVINNQEEVARLSPSKCSLLIVDDESGIRSQMKWALQDLYTVIQAADRPEALAMVKEKIPPVVCLDLGLPPDPGGVEEGFLALDQIIEFEPRTKVIVITGQEERKNALKAIQKGAYDFFHKPIETEVLKVVLARAFNLFDLEGENIRLRSDPARKDDLFEGMMGNSSIMQDAFSRIRKIATSDAPVLITGENGTGKELVAKAIHNISRRRKGEFVPINCGAIPENLLESELFGHEKGSFTGAVDRRIGLLEMASGGTLLLDEIGELSPTLQVKLLRFLNDGKLRRVGGSKEIDTDTRVVAATNIDLDESIKEGRFREDLFYRLAVVTVEVPPLRKRDDDVVLLANSFLQGFVEEGGKKISGFSQHAMHAIREYGWPGNIRELENRIRRSVIMAEGQQISPVDLGLDTGKGRFSGMNLKEAREALEKEMAEEALNTCTGNISSAAHALGISRPTLYEIIEKHGLRKMEKFS
jgi:two-component system, NtrC family, response regulator